SNSVQSRRFTGLEHRDMTTVDLEPLTVPVPLREDPPGVLRVGTSRVLLELVIHAYQRGDSPREIVEMYPSLVLGDVFAVIAFYIANQMKIDEYLRRCDEEADAIRRKIEASQPP